MYAGRGFDAATGEVIGRIDADTLLDPHWCGASSGTSRAIPGSTRRSQFFYELPWDAICGTPAHFAALDTYMNTGTERHRRCRNNTAIEDRLGEGQAAPGGRADLATRTWTWLMALRSCRFCCGRPRLRRRVSARRFRSSRKELLPVRAHHDGHGCTHDDQELVKRTFKKNKYAIRD